MPHGSCQRQGDNKLYRPRKDRLSAPDEDFARTPGMRADWGSLYAQWELRENDVASGPAGWHRPLEQPRLPLTLQPMDLATQNGSHRRFSPCRLLGRRRGFRLLRRWLREARYLGLSLVNLLLIGSDCQLDNCLAAYASTRPLSLSPPVLPSAPSSRFSVATAASRRLNFMLLLAR